MLIKTDQYHSSIVQDNEQYSDCFKYKKDGKYYLINSFSYDPTLLPEIKVTGLPSFSLFVRSGFLYNGENIYVPRTVAASFPQLPATPIAATDYMIYYEASISKWVITRNRPNTLAVLQSLVDPRGVNPTQKYGNWYESATQYGTYTLATDVATTITVEEFNDDLSTAFSYSTIYTGDNLIGEYINLAASPQYRYVGCSVFKASGTWGGTPGEFLLTEVYASSGDLRQFATTGINLTLDGFRQYFDVFPIIQDNDPWSPDKIPDQFTTNMRIWTGTYNDVTYYMVIYKRPDTNIYGYITRDNYTLSAINPNSRTGYWGKVLTSVSKAQIEGSWPLIFTGGPKTITSCTDGTAYYGSGVQVSFTNTPYMLLQEGDSVILSGTTHYDGTYTVKAFTGSFIWIDTPYLGDTVGGTLTFGTGLTPEPATLTLAYDSVFAPEEKYPVLYIQPSYWPNEDLPT